MWRLIVFATIGLETVCFCSETKLATRPFGLESRPEAIPFLLMPRSEDGPLPQVLSKTGAFRDGRVLAPIDSLIPYELNVSFWSDGASKWRWISLPNQKGESPQTIRFSPGGEWLFPNGTV